MLFFKQKKGSKQVDAKKNLLQNPKILEVNLIRDEVRISFDWNKNIAILIMVVFVAGVFVAEIVFGLSWWEKQEILKAQALDSEIAKVNREISNIKGKADEALAFKDKSAELTKLLDNHVYFSNFFNWLEKNTLSTVKFDGFSGDTSGKYTLSARALSYAEVSWQVKAFRESPLIKNVEVLSVNSIIAKNQGASQEVGVSFSLSFELDPTIFKK